VYFLIIGNFFLGKGRKKESGKHDVISDGLDEECDDDWLRLQNMHLRYDTKEIYFNLNLQLLFSENQGIRVC
jgi:hypothetical protein